MGFACRFAGQELTMEFTTISALVIIVLTVIPGYIFTKTKRRFCVFAEEHDWQHSLLSYVLHSLIILAIAWGAQSYIGQHPSTILNNKTAQDLIRQLVASPVAWGLTIFVVPIVGGYLAALAVRFNIVAWPYIIVSTTARRLGGRKVVRQLLAPLPSIVEGWDALYLELTTGGPHVVVVEKKSGSTVIGIFKSGSATSRHGTYPDLFLGQSCDITKDGRAIPNPDSRGIFIRGSEVATIALWNGTQERVHDGQSTARSMEGGASHDQN
ncbi:MAG: hypothetical protein ABS98_06375 [Lysobacteraceae bacterium SCN 69-48]|nr:MAG: hypothetical protein ABS98_06375 [Xanthomonadaceae bacterium SCN 69-48]